MVSCVGELLHVSGDSEISVHSEARGIQRLMGSSCVCAGLFWMLKEWPAVTSGIPFSEAVQFFKEYPSLLQDYQPSESKADKDSLGEEKGWIPDVQCVEFSLLLLFLASHLKLIAGCPGSAERLFHFSRENSLSVLSASTLASPRICFNLELEWSC